MVIHIYLCSNMYVATPVSNYKSGQPDRPPLRTGVFWGKELSGDLVVLPSLQRALTMVCTHRLLVQLSHTGLLLL